MTATIIDLSSARQWRAHDLQVLMVEFHIFDRMAERLLADMEALRPDLMLDGPAGEAARAKGADLAMQAGIIARLRAEVAGKVAQLIGNQAPAA